ncbi:MAG: redoxin domain-containing protein [Ekhidna sp.]
MKELIFIYLFLISNFLTFSQCSTSSEVADIVNALSNAENSYLNKEVPNLHFRTSKGENFDLLSLRGQVVTINYWAFTCRPCIAEMPELNKVVRKYQESVKFISIITPGDFEIESQIIQKN